MRKGLVVTLLCAGVALTACKKNQADDENTSADTTTVQGQDTVNGNAVPTTDTVVKTTTTDVDTIQGKGKTEKDTTKH